jgi:hypothetical protein
MAGSSKRRGRLLTTILAQCEGYLLRKRPVTSVAVLIIP